MSESDIEAAFLRASELSGGELEEFLDGLAPAVRDEVEALLAADAAARTRAFLGSSIGAAEPADDREGTQIGNYRLVKPIGEGGMGVVWLAEQEEPFRRKVALKLIRDGFQNPSAVARFEAERHSLAKMNHENVARIFDAGRTEDGRPYYVMELLDGVPITQHCDATQATIPQRLELFKLVCAGIQHAHQKGIIHRDLKPSNILVCDIDGVAVPKVIDFGLAKQTMSSIPGMAETALTEVGQILGTVQYMSPEQAGYDSQDIDTRTDIYSLGVVLYELLTGSPPIDTRSLGNALVLKALEVIREVDPPVPSSRLSESDPEFLSEVSRKRRVPPTGLQRQVRGELDWIVMKSLEKNRDRRYESANEFAGDIIRFLEDRPVEARKPSGLYNLRKHLWRHRRFYIPSAVLLAVLLASGISIFVVANERERQRRLRIEAEREVEFAQQRETTEKQYRLLSEVRENSTRRRVGWSARSRETLAGIPLPLPQDLEVGVRNEFGRLALFPDLAEPLPVHSGMRVSRIAFSPDQRWLALGENTSTFGNIRVVVVDAVSFEEKGTLRFLPGITGSDGVMALEFFDDGKRLAIGTRRGEVLIADIEAMQVSERWQVHDKNVDDLALAEDDSIIVTSSRDGKVRWWEVASKKRLKEVTANGNRHLVPYGDDLLVTDNGLKKVALDPKVEGGTQDFSVPAKSRLIRSDPSWGILNTGNFGETTLYSEIGQPVRRFYSNRFPESIVAIKVGFGGRLFSAYGTTACEIWSLQDGLRIGDFQSRQIRTVDLDPFLPRVFIAEDNRVIAIPAEMPAQNYPVHPGRIADVSFSPSGESVLTTVLLGTRTQMHIYDLSDFLLQKSQIVDSAIAAIALEDSGSSILFDPKSKSVTRVTLKGGQSTELIANTEQADYLRLDRKRNRLWLTRKPVARSLFGVETPTFWQVVCYSLKDQKLVSNWSDKKDALLSGRSHYSDLFVGEEHVVAANENFIAYAKHEEPKEFNKISVTGHSISCLAEAGGKILAGTLGGAVLVIDLTAESVIEIGTTDGAITSMCSEDDLLWIGTASGEVLHAEVNENKLTVITSLGPFSNSVESILVTQSASLVLRVRGESSLKQVDIKDLRAQWHMVLDP